MRQNHAGQPGIESAPEMAVVVAQARGGAAHEDLESSLVVPWLILPEQIEAESLWARHTSGPIALMLAILEDAVRCIQRGRRSRHRGVCALAAEAESWIRCDDREWPFAFASICDVLGLDVSAARAGLLADGGRHPSGNSAHAALLRLGRGPGKKRALSAPRPARVAAAPREARGPLYSVAM